MLHFSSIPGLQHEGKKYIRGGLELLGNSGKAGHWKNSGVPENWNFNHIQEEQDIEQIGRYTEIQDFCDIQEKQVIGEVRRCLEIRDLLEMQEKQ